MRLTCHILFVGYILCVVEQKYIKELLKVHVRLPQINELFFRITKNGKSVVAYILKKILINRFFEMTEVKSVFAPSLMFSSINPVFFLLPV